MGFFNLSGFGAVRRILESASCTECHSSSGTQLGVQATRFGDSRVSSCNVATQLVNFNQFNLSPLISYPSTERYGHKKIDESESSDYYRAVRDWLNQGGKK